ncbi:hypothetical protein F6Y03_30535 [Bacillus megaterium]|nr:hypothetical protein [Priestia megaterium]
MTSGERGRRQARKKTALPSETRNLGCQTGSFSFHRETQQPKAKAKKPKRFFFAGVSGRHRLCESRERISILLYNRKAKTTDDFREKIFISFGASTSDGNGRSGASGAANGKKKNRMPQLKKGIRFPYRWRYSNRRETSDSE